MDARVDLDYGVTPPKIHAILRIPNGHDYLYEDGRLAMSETPDGELRELDPNDVPDAEVVPWLRAIGVIPEPERPRAAYWFDGMRLYLGLLSDIVFALSRLVVYATGLGALVQAMWKVLF